jgi:hypothetical protein
MNQVVTTTPTIGSNVEEVEYKNLKFLMWVCNRFAGKQFFMHKSRVIDVLCIKLRISEVKNRYVVRGRHIM